MSAILFGTAVIATAVIVIRLESSHLRDVALKRFRASEKSVVDVISQHPLKFDFIIVGGGTAGCLLAGKLSEDFEVLLIEAGGLPPPLTSIPGLRQFVPRAKEVRWTYSSIPQPNLANRVIKFPVGKMLGGSFSSSGLVYSRGNSRDYDNWAKLTKDPSWNYENSKEVFKDLENYMGLFPSDERGSNGPFPIHTQNYFNLSNYVAAANELHYSYGDPSGPQMEGLAPTEFTIDSAGRAVTSFSVFVQPKLGSRNSLTVLTYAEAQFIILLGPLAKGIQYTHFKKRFDALARREVIVSAGTFGTPLLLYKSGIGPKDMLAQAGIPVFADLPVGKSYQDHQNVIFNATYMGITTMNQNLTEQSVKEYLKGQESYLSEPDVGAQMFLTSSIAKADGETNWPDIEFQRGPGKLDNDGNPYVTVKISSTRPSSSGNFKLNSSAFLLGERRNSRLAIIDPNLFESDEDIKRCVDGVQIALNIFNTKAFQSIGARVIPNELCLQEGVENSTSYWSCMIRKFGNTDKHGVGTCPMGSDASAIVDNNFRLTGFRRLRIIDASVMPRITNANVLAPTLLIAENGYRTILKTHKKPNQV